MEVESVMSETLSILSMDIKSLAILAFCGLLALFGIYKILRQSISLIFWVFLVVVGVLGIGYVLRPDMTTQIVDKIKSGEITNLIPENQRKILDDQMNSVNPAVQR